MVTTPEGEFELRQWKGRFEKALILENPDPILDDELRRLGIEPHRIPDAPDEAELVRLLEEGQHNLLFKRSRVEVTEPVVRASRNLAGVMLCCIGHDSVDKEACARHGVMVTNDPVSNGRSVAELVMGEMITLSRRIFDSVIEMQGSLWRKDNRARFELQGKRIGILGMGNIGRQVAQLAQAMGMDVYFYDTALVPREVGVAMGFTLCKDMEELFRVSDYVTVHVSAEDDHGHSNAGLVTYDCLKAMGDKPGESPRIFINLARGVLVDPDVLKRAIRDGHVSYAMTDVFPEEPGRSSDEVWVNPYEDEPRVFATPHIGAATREAQPRIARYVARTTQMFSDYGMLRNCVFQPRANIQFEVDQASSMLAVVHVDTRGTKKAVDDAIFGAGANNLRSAHIDFPKVGVAYDLSALDRTLTDEETAAIAREASELTGDPTAIRWVRTIPLDEG
ncbi:MAG: NAD(P)-dependent oxidoreductase [Myxococcota bacterium]